jgi:HEPN domain-containing protein
MPFDDRARTLAKEWVAAADRQLALAAMAFERQMWNEAVALSAGATERLLKAILFPPELTTPFRGRSRCCRPTAEPTWSTCGRSFK